MTAGSKFVEVFLTGFYRISRRLYEVWLDGVVAYLCVLQWGEACHGIILVSYFTRSCKCVVSCNILGVLAAFQKLLTGILLGSPWGHFSPRGLEGFYNKGVSGSFTGPPQRAAEALYTIVVLGTLRDIIGDCTVFDSCTRCKRSRNCP